MKDRTMRHGRVRLGNILPDVDLSLNIRIVNQYCHTLMFSAKGQHHRIPLSIRNLKIRKISIDVGILEITVYEPIKRRFRQLAEADTDSWDD